MKGFLLRPRLLFFDPRYEYFTRIMTHRAASSRHDGLSLEAVLELLINTKLIRCLIQNCAIFRVRGSDREELRSIDLAILRLDSSEVELLLVDF